MPALIVLTFCNAPDGPGNMATAQVMGAQGEAGEDMAAGVKEGRKGLLVRHRWAG